MANRSAQLFVISAPSGAGKTSLVQALVGSTEFITISVSHTTRGVRPGERDGVDYFFIDPKTFDGMIARAEFIEHAQVFGNLYGTSRGAVDHALRAGHDVVLEIDWQGARRIRALYPHATTIFIVPPSIGELQKRLELRGEDPPPVIERRMHEARAEMSHYAEYEYLIVNDVFAQALDDLRAIVRAVRLSQRAQIVAQVAVLHELVAS